MHLFNRFHVVDERLFNFDINFAWYDLELSPGASPIEEIIHNAHIMMIKRVFTHFWVIGIIDSFGLDLI